MIVNGILQEQCVKHLDDVTSGTLRIHSIETFGTHDGPGIRMVVFVQGCQFRCLYCANPDTMDVRGGKLMGIEEIVARAVRQKSYFGKKGGVTVSGGEPLLQRKALKVLFRRLHEEGINTALDSNGKLLNHEVEELLDETDLLLLDVKHFDDAWHHRITGLSNEGVFRVAKHRETTGKPMWIRYVLVPGWSDQEEYLHKLGAYFSGYKCIERIEILPYHTLGVHKWDSLGMEYKLKDVSSPGEDVLTRTKNIFSQYFTKVVVG
jgi:pyruvate formate lyase activating enzyme